MFTRPLRRTGAGALAGAVVAAGLTLVGPAPLAHAAVDPKPAGLGATWLNGRLAGDGLLHAAYADWQTGDPVPYTDHGGSIEAAYALDAVGRTGRIADIVAGMEGEVANYTGWDPERYAGPTGKLLSLVTDFSDTAPTAFGGVDLVAQMESLTTDAGSATAGRIVDQSAYGDYGNTFGQVWAVRGLLNAGSAEAGNALSFLLDQQCAAGFFRTYFAAQDAPDQTCDGASPAEDVPGPDAASFAIILLSEYAAEHPALAAALGEAEAWLAGRQLANGAFADDNGVANRRSPAAGARSSLIRPV